VEQDLGVNEIPKLGVQAAKTTKKLPLPGMVAYMNDRLGVSGMQRKGRKKLLGKRGNDQVTQDSENEVEDSETIEVEGPPANRQRVEPEVEPKVGSSPTITALVRARFLSERGRGRRRGGRQGG
jgi:hypothetical protein